MPRGSPSNAAAGKPDAFLGQMLHRRVDRVHLGPGGAAVTFQAGRGVSATFHLRQAVTFQTPIGGRYNPGGAAWTAGHERVTAAPHTWQALPQAVGTGGARPPQPSPTTTAARLHAPDSEQALWAETHPEADVIERWQVHFGRLIRV
eukprot:scaffold20339_cov120-Isochrysis_galbana.AAC.6